MRRLGIGRARVEARLVACLEARRARGRLRSLDTTVGDRLVDFASNDYLSLARDQAIHAASLREEMHESGHQVNGSTGSRLLTGGSAAHDAFEKWLAEFHGYEAATLFGSGYAANSGVAACVAGPEDAVFFDELSHNSTRFGLARSRQSATPFRHNSVADLSRLLRRRRAETAVVFVESVYSMDGDIAPLAEMAQVCEAEDACLVVDEAHATGVVGDSGRGALDDVGRDAVLCAVHTFGKAVGCHGAAVLGSAALRQYLANYSPPLIYATALSPAATRLAARCYRALSGPVGDDRRDRLAAVVSVLRARLADLDASLLDSASPVHALVVPGADRVSAVAADAQRAGFDVRPIRAPTVRAGSERLRIVAHAHNTPDEVHRLCDVLRDSLARNPAASPQPTSSSEVDELPLAAASS